MQYIVPIGVWVWFIILATRAADIADRRHYSVMSGLAAIIVMLTIIFDELRKKN